MRGGRLTQLALILLLSAASISGRPQRDRETKPEAETQTRDSVTNYHSHIYNISLDEAARRNPITHSAQSVKRGGKLFAAQCSMCHGKSAKGDGELAMKMKVHVPDFTNPKVLQKWTDGEIFAIQSRDFPVMPEQNYRHDKPKWDIVNYLRSISNGPRGEDMKQRHSSEVNPSQN